MKVFYSIALVLISLTLSSSVLAAPAAGFGQLYLDGEVVRTVVPPAASPMAGRDNIYPIVEGAEGQLPVAATGPGDTDYHGGKWAVHVVMWIAGTEPYLLTSEEDVLTAYMDGDVTITRMLEADFKCPIQKMPRR